MTQMNHGLTSTLGQAGVVGDSAIRWLAVAARAGVIMMGLIATTIGVWSMIGSEPPVQRGAPVTSSGFAAQDETSETRRSRPDEATIVPAGVVARDLKQSVEARVPPPEAPLHGSELAPAATSDSGVATIDDRPGRASRRGVTVRAPSLARAGQRGIETGVAKNRTRAVGREAARQERHWSVPRQSWRRTDARRSAVAPSASETVKRRETGPSRAGSDENDTKLAAPSDAVAVPARPETTHSEMIVLRTARNAVKSERYAQALRHLDRHAAQYPNGELRPEAAVLRVHALCALGRVHEAKRHAKNLARDLGSAYVRGRLEGGCAQ